MAEGKFIRISERSKKATKMREKRVKMEFNELEDLLITQRTDS